MDFNTAIEKTVRLDPPPQASAVRRGWHCFWCGCPFQVIAFIVLSLALCVRGPVIFGQSFLLKEPRRFECKTVTEEGKETWKECSKEQICERGLPKEDYRPIVDEYTFDNWVEKMDLLCED